MTSSKGWHVFTILPTLQFSSCGKAKYKRSLCDVFRSPFLCLLFISNIWNKLVNTVQICLVTNIYSIIFNYCRSYRGLEIKFSCHHKIPSICLCFRYIQIRSINSNRFHVRKGSYGITCTVKVDHCHCFLIATDLEFSRTDFLFCLFSSCVYLNNISPKLYILYTQWKMYYIKRFLFTYCEYRMSVIYCRINLFKGN